MSFLVTLGDLLDIKLNAEAGPTLDSSKQFTHGGISLPLSYPTHCLKKVEEEGGDYTRAVGLGARGLAWLTRA